MCFFESKNFFRNVRLKESCTRLTSLTPKGYTNKRTLICPSHIWRFLLKETSFTQTLGWVLEGPKWPRKDENVVSTTLPSTIDLTGCTPVQVSGVPDVPANLTKELPSEKREVREVISLIRGGTIPINPDLLRNNTRDGTRNIPQLVVGTGYRWFMVLVEGETTGFTEVFNYMEVPALTRINS